MKKLTSFLILLSLVSIQMFGQRYVNEIFTDVTVTTDVKYGENYSVASGTPTLVDLNMDVYEPVGDTNTSRPLVLIFHAGSFVQKGTLLPFGDNKDPYIQEICEQFAKRGFVAAAVGYRIGWNPLAQTQTDRAKSIIQAVYRAMLDGKAAVRFFKQNAATGGNTYGIDTTKIIAGGSNSGGYLALAMGYLDKQSEMELPKFTDGGNSYIDTSVLGNFDGSGGAANQNFYSNPGYTSDIDLVLNLGGAIGDTSWMEAGDVPVVSFHGEADILTPYETATVIVSATQSPVVEVSGSFSVAQQADRLGLNNAFESANFNDPYTQVAESRTSFEGLLGFPGSTLENGFEPWGWYDANVSGIATSDPTYSGQGSSLNPFACENKAKVYLDSVMSYFTPRAVVALGLDTMGGTAIPKNIPDAACPTVGVHELNSGGSLVIYPNPASHTLFIENNVNAMVKTVSMYDLSGRMVITERVAKATSTQLDLSSLDSGLYLVIVELEDGSNIQDKILLQR